MAYKVDTRYNNFKNTGGGLYTNLAYNDPLFALGHAIGDFAGGEWAKNYTDRGTEKGYGDIRQAVASQYGLGDTNAPNTISVNGNDDNAITVSGNSPSQQGMTITVSGNPNISNDDVYNSIGQAVNDVKGDNGSSAIATPSSTITTGKYGNLSNANINGLNGGSYLDQLQNNENTISVSGNPDNTITVSGDTGKKQQPSENLTPYIGNAISEGQGITYDYDNSMKQALAEAAKNHELSNSNALSFLANSEQERRASDIQGLSDNKDSEGKPLSTADKLVETSQKAGITNAAQVAGQLNPNFNRQDFLADVEGRLAKSGIRGEAYNKVMERANSKATDMETEVHLAKLNTAWKNGDYQTYMSEATRLAEVNPAVGQPYVQGIVNFKDAVNRANAVADKQLAYKQGLDKAKYMSDLQIKNQTLIATIKREAANLAIQDKLVWRDELKRKGYSDDVINYALGFRGGKSSSTRTNPKTSFDEGAFNLAASRVGKSTKEGLGVDTKAEDTLVKGIQQLANSGYTADQVSAYLGSKENDLSQEEIDSYVSKVSFANSGNQGGNSGNTQQETTKAAPTGKQYDGSNVEDVYSYANSVKETAEKMYNQGDKSMTKEKLKEFMLQQHPDWQMLPAVIDDILQDYHVGEVKPKEKTWYDNNTGSYEGSIIDKIAKGIYESNQNSGRR